MSTSDDQNPLDQVSAETLINLIWDRCEGTIGDAEAARLDSLLAADASNRAIYIEFFRMIACLEHDLSDPSRSNIDSAGWQPPLGVPLPGDATGLFGAEERPQFPIGSSTSVGPFGSQPRSLGESPLEGHSSIWNWFIAFTARPLPAAICASLLTLAGVLAFSSLARRESPSPLSSTLSSRNVGDDGHREDSRVPSVAYLASVNGCDWGSNPAQLRTVGNGVRSGEEVTLHEGIAEFRLSSGVAISLEGPASLIIASANSLAVQYGRVTAYVPWEAGDFRLLAGACRIAASEAEFGVRVTGSDLDVHSFSGKVLADVTGEFGVSPVAVEAGRGVALRSSGSVTEIVKWHAAEPSEFATKLSMAGPLPITAKYVNSVLASKPIHYWRFEECKDQQIANEITGSPPLEVVGDMRLVVGGGNTALEMGRPGSEGFLTSHELFDICGPTGYSVELWAKPSHVHDAILMSLTANEPLSAVGREQNAFDLEFCGPCTPLRLNLVRFLHRDPPGTDTKTGTSCFSKVHYAIRRWQHIATVKDGEEMRLYLDGVVVCTAREASSLAPFMRLVVGQSGPDRRVFPFVGQLDELAIYSHPLTQAEVEEHAAIPKLKRPRPIPPLREA